MIIETVVTSVNEDGSANIAPMGAVTEAAGWEQFELRPFDTARTCGNLLRTRGGVLHLTDDPLLFAQAIAGEWPEPPALVPFGPEGDRRIAGAVAAHRFRVVWSESRNGRTVLRCRTMESTSEGQWCGLSRARSAVIEAAVLVSRLGLIPDDQIARELERLAAVVSRTGGEREQRALALLSCRLTLPQGEGGP